jgi:hypothetical protein
MGGNSISMVNTGFSRCAQPGNMVLTAIDPDTPSHHAQHLE